MLVTLFFGVIETIFLWSSLAKFMHGGYVAVFIALIIGGIMFIWYKGNQITSRLTHTLRVRDYLPQLEELHDDTSYPLLQSNVVYLTKVMEDDEIEAPILYSILDKKPKRALVYWFVNIEVTDQPYTKTYEINLLSKHVVLVKFKLGFRISQDVNIYLRQIVTDLMASGEIDKQPQKYSVDDDRQVGDFRFVLLDEGLSAYSGLKGAQKQLLHFKFAIRRLAVSPARWFGLEFSDVLVERVPIIIESNKGEHLMRVAEVD
jgi:KUP system potassium uptake protein